MGIPKIDVVVTRHPGLVSFLIEEGLISSSTKIFPHATPEVVTGKNVLGVLPHSLSVLTETFTEVPLNLPPELRGKELTKEQVRKYASEPVTYKVEGAFSIKVTADGHSDRGNFDLGFAFSLEEAKQIYDDWLATDCWDVFYAAIISHRGERYIIE